MYLSCYILLYFVILAVPVAQQCTEQGKEWKGHRTGHHLSSPERTRAPSASGPGASSRLTSLGDAMRQSEEWIQTSLPVPETDGGGHQILQAWKFMMVNDA